MKFTDVSDRQKVLQNYKRTIASRYRALTEAELDELPPGRYHVSPKIDGQLWFAWVSSEGVELLNRTGRTLGVDAPVCQELNQLLQNVDLNTVIAGELFAVPASKTRPRVGDITSALGSAGDTKRIGFQAFDVVLNAGEAPSDDYGIRQEHLSTWFNGGKRAKFVKTQTVAASEITELYAEYVASGKAEGLIARADDGRIYKIKPKFSVDCLVLGYTHKHDDEKAARSLLLGLERPDGQIQVVGSCGNLGSDSDREALAAKLEKTIIDSEFRKVASSGALYKLCAPSLVVEIEVSDVQSEDASGNDIRQWVIQLNESHGWQVVAPTSGASLIHPRLGCIRDDKQPMGTDIRFKQLAERCLTPNLDKDVKRVDMPKSQLLRREVYTKAAKGSLAVRKLVVWATHKGALDLGFPHYVVHFTDYSPSRAAPLKREVRLAQTEEAAKSIADGMLKSNIKKGWNIAEGN